MIGTTHLSDHLIDRVIEGPVQIPAGLELKKVYATEAPGHHILELLQCADPSEEWRYTWQIRNARGEVVWSSTAWYFSRTSAYQAARREIERLGLGVGPFNAVP
ncbi:hypothetical protein [Methylocaldum sp. GT1BB]|uniref:hypothetical protein n=1 Tax=Methylocaldum sp. GT1BB TaxID=3438963 RepID=UPI003DA17B9A